ncbi:hypothetical protein L7F22_013833 [Adiantum nelumboides]|nr:hypothetical protein [Adiantum nelumboides]
MDNDEHLKRAYAFFDLNGDGFIDSGELQEMLQGDLGEESIDMLKDIIQEIDTDKNGRISYDEFANMMRAGTDWRKASRNFSRERYASLSINLDMMTMMQELRLNVLGGGGGHGRGRGRGVAQPYEVQSNANLGRGQGAFEPPRRFIPTCYNCGELGHIRTQCPRPIRMGGDMFPLPQQIPNRANDYALDIRGDQGAEQENQASTSGGHVGIVRVEKKEADMMPLGKREREGYAAPGPSKKKEKE